MSCEEGPDAYQLRLGEIGKLDVIHLGLGLDGHTASLFPESPALDADPGQLVARNEDPSGRNRLPRLTLTYAGIARSRLAVFTVAGRHKRAALQALVDGADLPAGPRHRRSGHLAGGPGRRPPLSVGAMADRGVPPDQLTALLDAIGRHRQPRSAAGDPGNGGATGVGPHATAWT